MPQWPGEGDTPRHTRVVQLLTQLKDVVGVDVGIPPEKEAWSLAADLHACCAFVLKEVAKEDGCVTDATVFTSIASWLLSEDGAPKQPRR